MGFEIIRKNLIARINASAGADANAIHKNTAGEISTITEKTSLANDDLFIIEDSANAFVKKKVKKSNVAGAGGGDMYKSTYDPGSINNNAFNQDYMIDGATNKNYSAADKSKLAAIEANATKYPDTGEQAFTDALKSKLDGIAAGAEVNVNADWNATGEGNDAVILNKPTIPADSDLFHKSVSDEIHTVTSKNPISLDWVLGEDSEDLFSKKAFRLDRLPISTSAQSALDAKQATLVSGTNIKTINSTSLLSSGDIVINEMTDEKAQDAVGAMVDANSLVYTDVTPLLAVKRQMSIDADANGLKLSGDSASPGNSMLYGTNSGGTKGWYVQPGGAPTGVLDDLQISVLQSDGTLNAASGVQTWAGTNKTGQDVFTLVANSTYAVRGQLILNTGSTTHTTALAWALSGATIADFQYLVMLWSAALNTIATAQSTVLVSGVASKVLNATSTAVYTHITFEGIMNVTNGGTITPQINFSANPTGTNLMKRGSWISFSRLGANTFTQNGGWA